MRIRSLIAAGFMIAGLPLLAQDAHQSYVTYDDSDSVLVQNDGKEVDVRVNLPVYPGDEVRAARRGRTELRLADGNIIALDRDSVVKFQSMLLNYEEGGEQTVVALVSGHVVVFRRYEGSEPLRLDAPNASFVSNRESIYGVEANSKGIDVVTVFEGSVEVRTPSGTTLLNAGDRAKVDPTGLYDRRAISNVAATEFERWFLMRAEKYSNKESRHLDASLAYAEDDLDENGRWVYVKDYNQWAWSPYVSTGWRPYYNGYWGWGANGSCWISYEPWGWVPYHYGNWSYVSSFGWMWFPGSVYAPAWVYWAWGPSWVGWVPWGYYSYYGGYYPWLYDPYCNPRVYGRYGFNGHVNVSSGDLSAYTVVDRTTLFSNRIDRAALTSDAVRDRLARDGGRANFTNQPIRVNRTDMKDPSTAVDRIIRGSRDGSGTGSVGAGSSGDLTQFFQRDPALSQDVRDRVTRGQSGTTAATTGGTRGRNTLPSGGGGTVSSTTTQPGRGGVRGGGGTGGTIDRPSSTGGSTTTPTTGTTAPRGGGTSTVPRGGGSTTGGSTSTGGDAADKPATNRPTGGTTTPRTQTPDAPDTPVTRGGADTPTVDRSGSGGSASSSGGEWRGRPVRSGSSSGSSSTTNSSSSNPRTTVQGGDTPVSRPSTSGTSSGTSLRSTSTSTRGSTNESWRGAGDTVRRVIGSIGGARLTPSSRGSSSSGTKGGSSSSTRSGSGSSSTRGSGGSGSVSKPSSGSSSSSGSPSTGSSSGGGGSSRSSGSSGGSSSSGGSRSSGGGGKVNRGG